MSFVFVCISREPGTYFMGQSKVDFSRWGFPTVTRLTSSEFYSLGTFVVDWQWKQASDALDYLYKKGLISDYTWNKKAYARMLTQTE